MVLLGCSDPDIIEFIDFNENALINQVMNESVPIDADPLLWSNPHFIDAYANRPVIGLGEATHGTQEFFEAKAMLFRYLAEEQGFRTFCIEADFAESLYIDDCLQDPECDVSAVMADRMIFWTWRTAEVRDLLLWIQEFNRSRDDDDRIHYVGIDGQALIYQSQLLLDFLLITETDLYEDWGDDIRSWTDNTFTSSRFESMTEQEYEDQLVTMNLFLASLLNRKEALEQQVTPTVFANNVQLVVTIIQAFEVNYHFPNNKAYHRDQWMAENVLWAKATYAHERGLAIWAHNGHVAKDKYYDFYRNPSMGFYLFESLGMDYAVVGFGFSRGSFTAVSPDGSLETMTIDKDPKRGSLTELFHHAKRDAFWLDVQRIAEQSELGRFASSYKPYLTIGAAFNGFPEQYYRQTDLAREYDGVIFFENTHASDTIPRSSAKGVESTVNLRRPKVTRASPI